MRQLLTLTVALVTVIGAVWLFSWIWGLIRKETPEEKLRRRKSLVGDDTFGDAAGGED
jgi:hypothetical protein